MAFDAQIVHWRSIAEFAAHLATVPRPSWCDGITHHNTYQPDDLNWRGMASMLSMRDFYRDTKQWPSGPNLFLAAKSPNPADRGIWQMTPITRPGTHAGACNAHRLGIENVGDFDKAPPTPDQYTLLITITLLILQQWGLPPETVNVHRDCMPGRTCPGKYLTSEQIRASLNTSPSDPFERWGLVGKPTGAAQKFAVPLAWLVNKKLGKCVTPETYTPTGKFSVTEFETGIITYFTVRNTTRVELF